MIRVLVRANSRVVRAGLESVLRDDGRFEIVPDRSTRVTQAIHQHAADVVLIDGIFFASGPAEHPRDEAAAVVACVDPANRAEIRRLFRSGVRAILERDSSPPEIVAAVEAAAAGLAVVSPDVLDALLPPMMDANAEDLPGEALTPRESEVLSLLAGGAGNKEIASRLHISEHTVKFHVSSILGKLGAATRTEAVTRGYREGLIVV